MTARLSIVPADAFRDPRLTPSDVRVLGVLGSFLNKKYEAWPSQGRIAEEARVDRKTANRALRKLVDLGYVRCTQRGSGKWKTSLLYQVEMNDEVRLEAEDAQAELFPTVDFGQAKSSMKPDGEKFPIVDAATPENPSNSGWGKIPHRESPMRRLGAPSDEAPECPNRNVTNRTSPDSSVSNETAKAIEPEDHGDNHDEPAPTPTSGDLKRALVFGTGVTLLRGQGLDDRKARTFLGGLIKASNLDIVARVMQRAAMEPPIEAKAWLTRAVAIEARRAGLANAAASPEAAAERRDARIEDLDRRMGMIAQGKIMAWQPLWGPDPRYSDEDVPDALYAKHGIPKPAPIGQRRPPPAQPHQPSA